MKKRTIVIVLALCLSLMWTLAVHADETYDYTLLIFMNGSDLESEYYAGTDDFLELIQGNIPPNIAVIVETGGTSEWHTLEYDLPAVSSKVNQRWRVTQDTIELVDSLGSSNMGASNTLSNFIQFGVNNYPSDQYALVLWNHGAGAIYGYGADEKNDYDTMTLDELQTALETAYAVTNQRFDLIGFDACLMASVEVAHVLEPYADYMVGSEELEPGHGWSYRDVMDHLADNIDSTPSELGQAIIEGFVDQSEDYGTSDAITLSLIDLSEIDAVLTSLDKLLARALIGLNDQDIKEFLLKARLESESYGEGNSASDIPDSDMVDIIDFATRLNEYYPAQAEELVLAIYEAVDKNINSSYKPNASGLSMYIPAKDKETMAIAYDALVAIDMPDQYLAYIQKTISIITGNVTTIDFDETIVDAETNTQVQINLENNSIEGDDQFYYFQVPQDDISLINEVYTIMGLIDEAGDIQYLARDRVDDDAMMDDGVIIGETLEYWVEIDGIPVAMYYENHDATGVINYYIPIQLNGEDADLIVLFSHTYPNGKILGARRLDTEHENIYNRSLIALKPDDVIDFIYEYDLYDINSDTYSYDGWYQVDSTKVGQGLLFTWEPLAEGNYAYAFEIEDIYGNRYQTDWLTYLQSATASTSNTVDDAIWDNLEENTIVVEGEYPWLAPTELAPSEWAIPYVNTAYNNGLTTEKTLKNFTSNITREEFCELVVNMYERSTGKTIAISQPIVFDDTSNLAITKAYQIGIVSGYGNGVFGPDDEITREQLMTMFYRALVLLDPSYGEVTYPDLTFIDVLDVESWASEGTKALVYYELVNGVGGNRLSPKTNATIEQALKLVNGVYEFYLAN